MKMLHHIGQQHGTDKADFHQYLDRYEPFLEPWQAKQGNLLEMGVDGGASIKMWRDYFLQMKIYGVDHNPGSVKFDLGPRVHLLLGEVTAREFWEQQFPPPVMFDIIIDDAGHHSSAIISTFTLAWPRLNRGGIYIIEDLHCSYDRAYNRTQYSDTSMEWLKDMLDAMNCHGLRLCGNPADGPSPYSFMHFSKSFCIIGKP